MAVIAQVRRDLISFDNLVRKLVTALEQIHAPDDVLDGYVYDVFSQQASSINNNGFAEQIRFLIESFGVDNVVEKIDIIVKEIHDQT